MPAPAQLRLLLACAVLALVGLRQHRRNAALPVVYLPSSPTDPAPLQPEARRLEPDFGARMTPDDVARGLWALARGQGPRFPDEQAARLLPIAREARSARARVDAQRAARRAARAEARTAGALLAVHLVDLGWAPGSERLP